MDPNPIELHLGEHADAVEHLLDEWVRTDLAGRLWRRDVTLWGTTDTPELADRLGWLDLHDTMVGEIPKLEHLASDFAQDGLADVLVLGMGGSSLAPQVFGAVFGRKEGPSLQILDSTHPDAVRAVAERIDPSKTAFVVSSKSGTTIETLSLFRLFWAGSGRAPGRRFVAVTDPGTSLVRLGLEGEFRGVMEAPPDVGGRYSALTHFGLAPAALAGIDLRRMLDAAAVMATACTGPASDNPALRLGAAWAALAGAGLDKLTFLTSPSVRTFPAWAEQLVAESLGKEGKGIVPVVDELVGPPFRYGGDRVFSYLSVKGDRDEFAPAGGTFGGHPMIRIRMTDRFGLIQEMVRCELATAAAGASLGVHPFDQPDVELAKQLARRALSGGAAEEVEEVDSHDGKRLRQAVTQWRSGIAPRDYVSIQAYLAPTPEVSRALEALRLRLRDEYLVATTIGEGPRFLHSTGQLHKGGPNNGVFLQLVDQPDADLAIPETGTTFGRLIAAQAIGDFLALRQRGRRVLRVNLGHDRLEGLAAIAEAIVG